MTAALAARSAAAGCPTMPGPRIIHTVPWALKITDPAQVVRQTVTGLSNTGLAASSTIAPIPGGQTSFVRLTVPGGNGTLFRFPEIEAAPINMGGRYLRTLLRRNDGAGVTRFLRWRFADTKAAHDAGNYAEFNIAPTPLSNNGTANYLPEATFTHDAAAPELTTTVGSGVSNWGSVGYLGLFVQQGTAGVAWDLAGLELITRTADKAKCVIWHDDTVLYGATALNDRMLPYGFVWQEATEWEQIDYPGQHTYFTSGEAAGFAATGTHFGSHATMNNEHTQTEPPGLQNQAIRNRLAARRLNLSGTEVGDLAWWGGQSYVEDYLNVVRQYYRSGRGNTSGITRPEMIPPAEPALYKSLLADTRATAFIDLYQPLVDAAIAVKGLATFVIHQDLGNTGTNSDQFRSNFDQLLAYLDTHRSLIDVTVTSAAFASCT